MESPEQKQLAAADKLYISKLPKEPVSIVETPVLPTFTIPSHILQRQKMNPPPPSTSSPPSSGLLEGTVGNKSRGAVLGSHFCLRDFFLDIWYSIWYLCGFETGFCSIASHHVLWKNKAQNQLCWEEIYKAWALFVLLLSTLVCCQPIELICALFVSWIFQFYVSGLFLCFCHLTFALF